MMTLRSDVLWAKANLEMCTWLGRRKAISSWPSRSSSSLRLRRRAWSTSCAGRSKSRHICSMRPRPAPGPSADLIALRSYFCNPSPVLVHLDHPPLLLPPRSGSLPSVLSPRCEPKLLSFSLPQTSQHSSALQLLL